MSRSKAPLIECPFFEKFTDYGVRCEGLALNSYLDQHFKTRSDREEWMNNYCFKGDSYKYCPIAALLNEYYNSGGSNE